LSSAAAEGEPAVHGTEPARYRAFISYSHRDAAFGRALHRRLEAYRLPRRLVGLATARGPAPSRLSPIFRDREELAAADDLSVEVRAALAASGALIVVCSPNAYGSSWVSREVELFRELHPGRPVLAALIDGEPGEAFPPPCDSPAPMAIWWSRSPPTSARPETARAWRCSSWWPASPASASTSWSSATPSGACAA
jgi:hypothetical protein